MVRPTARQQPTTARQQPTAGRQQPTTARQQPTTARQQPTTAKQRIINPFPDSTIPNLKQKASSISTINRAAQEYLPTGTSITFSAADNAGKVLGSLGAAGAALTQAAPGVGFLASIVNFFTSFRKEKIVTQRLQATENILKKERGLTDLAPGKLSELQKKQDMYSQKSASEVVLHTLQFAKGKMESRIRKLKLVQVGSIVAGTGAVLAGVGFFAGGIGAIPGLVIGAIGGAIGMLPTLWGGMRAIYKNLQGTKGVDRKSSAQFLWGLALRKAVMDRKILYEDLPPKAKAAYNVAKRFLRTNKSSAEDKKKARNLAVHFLEDIGVRSGRDLVHQDAYNQIKRRLSSKDYV